MTNPSCKIYLGFGHWNLNYCEMIIRYIEESADKEEANGPDQTVVDRREGEEGY